MAKVPVEDLRYAAAYRLVSDDIRRNLARQVVARDREVEALRNQIKALQEAASAREQALRPILERNDQLLKANTDLSQRVQRQKPWATIGKVTIGLCVVGVGYSVYKATAAP